jgi:hypothetical protein
MTGLAPTDRGQVSIPAPTLEKIAGYRHPRTLLNGQALRTDANSPGALVSPPHDVVPLVQTSRVRGSDDAGGYEHIRN